MAAGMWTMKDDGSFELQEPWATKLQEAKRVAAVGWREALCEHLATTSPYSPKQLNDELMVRIDRNDNPVAIIDEFILEALSGDL